MLLGAALAQDPTHGIHARAGFRIYHPAEGEIGACSLVVNVTGSQGSIQYAAEDHSGTLLCSLAPARYPEIVVKSTRILAVAYQGNRVTMTADGTQQGDPIRIELTAVDRGRSGRNDSFEIRCTDSNGALVYQRGGTVESGDIAIR